MMYLWKLNDPRMHLRVRLHRDSSCICTRAVLFHPAAAAAAVHTPHASSFQLFPSCLWFPQPLSTPSTPAPRSGQLWIYPSLTASYLFSSSPTFSFSPSSHLCPWALTACPALKSTPDDFQLPRTLLLQPLSPWQKCHWELTLLSTSSCILQLSSPRKLPVTISLPPLCFPLTSTSFLGRPNSKMPPSLHAVGPFGSLTPSCCPSTGEKRQLCCLVDVRLFFFFFWLHVRPSHVLLPQGEVIEPLKFFRGNVSVFPSTFPFLISPQML